MDKQITVIAKQSLADIAVQGSGSVENIFDVADANNLSITKILSPGDVLSIPTIGDTDVATYYDHKQLRPVSEYTTEDYTLLAASVFYEGIGYWYIQRDFVVYDPELDE